MDFGFEPGDDIKPIDNGDAQTTQTSAPNNTPSDKDNVTSMGEPIADLGDDEPKDNKGDKKDNTLSNKGDEGDKGDKEDKKSSKTDDKFNSDLEEGSVVEVDGESYTVDKDGNLLDKDGKIFKEAKDVAEWMKGFNVDNSDVDTEFSINTIQDAVGIEITDDNDKPIEFDNTPEGVAAYVNAVIETAKDEQAEIALNTLYQKYPVLQDVLNYYIANGNSMDGYGELPDRSGITINKDDEAQQENIIRIAWREQNRKGDVNAYLQYLKNSGTLLAVAQEELDGLKEADAQYRKDLEDEAERLENERIEQLENYWNGVYDVIKTRNLAGYTIPENIIINRNGQKLSVTPEDFFNYIYRVDDEGKSAYERDLAKETPESRRDDELLRAYLKFVGGNYSNLVDMAINEDKVKKLKLTAKQRQTSTVKVRKPKAANKAENMDFDY